jgi:DUF3060 family protein
VTFGDDPQQRIAELERELAEQRRINQLQDQLADARGVTPAPVLFRQRSRPSRTYRGANLFGAVAGAIGFCAGGAAALTAVLPSSALWTSSIVCGGRNQLMVNTSHYSYKPNQSGTTVGFQCLRADGAHDASWFTITVLQSILVTLMLAGVAAVAFVMRRKARQQPVSGPQLALASGLGTVAVAAAIFVVLHTIASSSSPIQMPPGGNLAIRGNAETQTIACNGGHLSVDGREMTVNVTGHCARISVDGVIHHITVDSADAIDVDGLNNVVIYHSGSPQITKSGAQNTVRQG